jgi:hypothetical protein
VGDKKPHDTLSDKITEAKRAGGMSTKWEALVKNPSVDQNRTKISI